MLSRCISAVSNLDNFAANHQIGRKLCKSICVIATDIMLFMSLVIADKKKHLKNMLRILFALIYY